MPQVSWLVCPACLISGLYHVGTSKRKRPRSEGDSSNKKNLPGDERRVTRAMEEDKRGGKSKLVLMREKRYFNMMNSFD